MSDAQTKMMYTYTPLQRKRNRRVVPSLLYTRLETERDDDPIMLKQYADELGICVSLGTGVVVIVCMVVACTDTNSSSWMSNVVRDPFVAMLSRFFTTHH